MRHNKKTGMKLGTDASHTKAMKKSLVRALFENDRIKTIDVRAKAIRGDVDKIITWAKKGDIASRRLAIAALGEDITVRQQYDIDTNSYKYLGVALFDVEVGLDEAFAKLAPGA